MAASITCLCGDIKQSIHLDATVDHSHLQLCHCTNCRTITGLLGAAYYLMLHEPATDSDRLQTYSESPHVTRFFCRTCGAHIFARLGSSSNPRHLVAAGVLVAGDIPPVKVVQHWQTEDTIDGGLSAFFPGWPSTEGCALQKAFGQDNNTSNSKSQKSPATSTDKSELHAQCHCGGIEFYITPPDASSYQARSPWPDLLAPYHSESSENPNDVKWWLCDNGSKYLAGTCVCVSCRLGSGFPIQTWAFVPKSNILNTDRSPLSFNRGTMQQYNSSPGAYREFCNRCGANVFWHNDERPTIVDVSVGLLRGNGARVESWLEWATGRVSFTEMAQSKDLVGLLEAGLQDYGRKKKQ